MTNSNHHIDARDLSSRLNCIAQNDTSTIHDSTHDTNTMSGNRRVTRATSFDSLPRFKKSSTMSSTSTGSTQFSGLHSYPSRALHRKDVEVSPGEFSMPRVPKRSRRGTASSQKSSKSEGKKKSNSFEAHAYGRHSNQWLFNDFSITDAVKKGYGKVFGRDN
ncbi:uncharacterized protein M421DRAFT_423074 [Didymella exigua CBS 183.55]|uniref:Uncharacterized protein n=1 Tax=Didymella exigua CBS 183.55 TaxID=1150837 RepID=A0A6A5RCV8_9PLEO|nr:uncharacterized protein M421DRAFT_423074 [Didymella exigua CBS 183.55]KAF1926071.1 hypothetical protein M421DRAFT_423074 [Didymella exigua CBS 183.55]